MKKILFYVTGLSLFLNLPLWAARTLVVAADGTGDFKTIAEAHKEAKAGDTVFIRGGTEKGRWPIKAQAGLNYASDKKDPVSIEIKGVNKVKISKMLLVDWVDIENSQNITIEDCLIKGYAPIRAPYDPKSTYYPDTVRVKNSKLVSLLRNRITGGPGAAVNIGENSDALIEGNVIYDNWGGGIKIDAKAKVKAVRNTIAYNRFYQEGFDIKKLADDIGLYKRTKNPPNWTVEALYVQLGAGEGRGISLENKGSLVLEDNIIAFNDAGIVVNRNVLFDFDVEGGWFCRGRTHPVMKNNLVHGNKKIEYDQLCNLQASVSREEMIGDKSFTGGKNISADPKFMDASKGDFRLSTDSPALTAGVKKGPLGAPGEAAAGDGGPNAAFEVK